VKVLLVSNGFPPSGQWGTEYYTHQLATGLAARGDEVVVLHPVRDEGRPRFSLRRVERYGLSVWELANAGDPRKRFADSYLCEGVERAFERVLEEEAPQVAHFMHLLWGLSVRLPGVARRRGLRTIVTPTDFGLVCHRGQLLDWRQEPCEGPSDAERCARCVREPGEWDHPPLRRRARGLAAGALASLGGLGRVVVGEDILSRERVVRAALEDVDHWILPTRALGERLRAAGIDPERATCLPYGIDEAAYLRPRSLRPDGRLRFVYMSQYMPHKGLACLVEAARRLARQPKESGQSWSLELHGNGTGDRHRLYAPRVLSRLAPGLVVDRGPFEPLDAPRVLASSEWVVVPSEWCENAPLTVLQARAAGVPVIASDVPGIAEVMEEGRHGRLFRPGDVAALTEVMAAALRGELPRYEPDPLVSWDEHLERVRAVHRGRAAAPVAGARPASLAIARR